MAVGAVIGALRANLSLNTAEFSSGANQARATLATMRNQFAAVAAAATAMGAAITAAAFSGASEIDKLAKSARRMDATIAGFRTLQLVASEAGAPMEVIADNMQNLNRVLAVGGDKAEEALSRLSLTFKDLSGLDSDQKLAMLADAAQKSGFSAGALTAILKDLGIKSKEMTLMVMGGGDAIRSARADIESYGLAISGVDAAKIEAANDKIARLGMISEYVKGQLALTIIPAFGELAKAITDSLKAGGALRTGLDLLIGNLQRMATYVAVAVTAFGVRYVVAFAAARLATLTLAGALTFLKGALIRTGIGALVVGVGELVFQFTRLYSATGSASESFRLMGRVALAVFNSVISGAFYAADRIAAGFGGALKAIVSAFMELPNILGAVGRMAAAKLMAALMDGIVNKLPNAVGSVIDAVNGQLGRIHPDLALSRLPKMEFEFDTSSYENEAVAAFARAGTAASTAFSDAWGETTFADPGKLFDVGTISQEWGGITSAISAANPVVQEAADTVADLNDELEDLGKEKAGSAAKGVKEAKEKVEELSEAAQAALNAVSTLRDGMSNAFASVVTGAKTARAAVGELLKSMATMIANKAFQQLFTGLMGTGVAGGNPTGFGSFISSLIGGNANGTKNFAGGLTMVGERGKELVSLPRGSQVVDAQKTASMLSQGGGQSTMRVLMGEGLVGEILGSARDQAVTIVQEGLDVFSTHVLPARQTQIAGDPRRRG